jgi:dinuclear metal center YbgI/SA1388 family protein
MTVLQIYTLLDTISPFQTQESWDNSGLNIGSKHQEVESIYLSIDITKELIDRLPHNSLIITHHPLFLKQENIIFDEYPYNLVQIMAQKNISLISMHTNFDKSHLNSYVCTEILGYEIVKKDEFFCYFNVNRSFDEFALDVKNSLNLKFTKNIKAQEYIKTAVLTTGSGASLIPKIEADCFLSGDMKYHDSLSAKERGLSIIDIGHYESEIYFADILDKELKIKNIFAIIANSRNPFSY